MPNNFSSKEKQQLIKEYNEILLKLALHDYVEQEGKRLYKENENLKENPEYQPSPESEKKFLLMVDREIRKMRIRSIVKNTPKHLNKVASILVIAGFLFAVSVLTVDAFRESVIKFMMSMQKEYTSIRFADTKHNTEGEGMYVDWSNAYSPAYIPPDYKISNLTNTEMVKNIEYTNDSGVKIWFSQMEQGATLNIDTENAQKVEDISINDNKGILVLKDGLVTIVWHNEEYLFSLFSEIDEKELIKIANSVKLIE